MSSGSIGRSSGPQPWDTYSKTDDDNLKVARVSSTDNAIVRFDGTSGLVQNSSVVIDDSGNVGIGTSSPSTILNVRRDQSATTVIKVENQSSGNGAVTNFQAAADVASLAVGVDSSTKTGTIFGLNRTSLASVISFNDSALSIGTYGATPVVFGTNNSERMRLDSSGNAMIGYTSCPTGAKLTNYISGGATTTPIANLSLMHQQNTGYDHAWTFRTKADGPLTLSRSDQTGWTTFTDMLSVTSSGNLQFNSGYGSVATAYGCRAWVNFNGQGTVAIRASGNVSSITDNGVGNYIVNFSIGMPDSNYSVATSGYYWSGYNTSGSDTVQTNAYSTGSFYIFTKTTGSGYEDLQLISAAAFR